MTRGPVLAAVAPAAFALLVGACSERGKSGPEAAESVGAKLEKPVALGEPAASAQTSSGAPASGATPPAESSGLQAPHPAKPVGRHGIVWYEDEPDAAFAAARATGKRVVVDLWAPWCHTCLSMQSVVLTAQNLAEAVPRFVWLAIDTERESNAKLLERLPVSVWPTFYVVDVAEVDRVEIAGRWLGAASPTQFRRFLAESDRSPGGPGAKPAGNALEALSNGDALAAQGRHADAARAYTLALERAPASWERRPETRVAQITALYKAEDYGACLNVAAAGLGQTGNTASAIDFSSYALECASAVGSDGGATHGGQAKGKTDGAPQAVATLRRAVVARLEPLCGLGHAELAPDDRADACDKLSQARSALGDAEGARHATESRLAVLERAALGKHGEAALTYDWARTDALLRLGRSEEALAVATERERQLPDNYNPPHYRAKALKALGRWDEGLAAIERALSLAYGPRRIGLLTLEADLLFAAGRPGEAVRTLQEQLAAYRALPAGQRQPNAEARVERRLLEAAPKPSVAPAPGR
jgi:tetratricopeptide (TPR) repeat protein/thiol-disulfide isomerase/thioredoxin